MRDYAKLIGHLIANAEDERQSDEARAAYRAKAEKLMREYRISEEQTIAQDQFSIVPQRFEVVLLESDAMNNPLQQFYFEIWREVAKHAGIRFRIEYRYPKQFKDQADEDRQTGTIAVGYGYESDIRLAELLWISARLVFMTRIDAKPDPKLSDQENCYYLRNSGMKRNDIAHALWGSAYNDGHAHGKVQKLYLAECAARNEKPRVTGRGLQVALYRQAYANAFCDGFGWKLREARDAADAEGGSLVLPGRAQRVAEAFYAAFPDQRPMTPEEYNECVKKFQEVEDECEACKKSKSQSGKCRSHRPMTVTEAERKRWERERHSPEAHAGRVNGAAAARAVNVSRTAGPRTQRAEASPERQALGG